MAVSVPKWVTDLTIVGLIFSAGIYYNDVSNKFDELNKKIQELRDIKLPELDKKVAIQESAISIHHGSDWSKKVESNSLSKVVDLEGKLNQSLSKFSNEYETSLKNVSDVKLAINAIRKWAHQQDVLVYTQRLEQFRALAVYATANPTDITGIYINKQHVRGDYYNKGDKVTLINPLPPGLQVEVVVKGFLDDPNSANILVQLNKGILADLGLTTKDGKYELFVKNNSDMLRWMSIKEIFEDTLASQ